MSKMIDYSFHGMNVKIDKNEFDAFKKKRGYEVSLSRMEQYLLNDCDKSKVDPFNIDINMVISQFTQDQIEEIINYYIAFENKMWR